MSGQTAIVRCSGSISTPDLAGTPAGSRLRQRRQAETYAKLAADPNLAGMIGQRNRELIPNATGALWVD